MKRTRKISTSKKAIRIRRFILSLPALILVSIPLFQYINLFIMNIEQKEATFNGNIEFANSVVEARNALDGFVYNLPHDAKIYFAAVLSVTLLFIILFIFAPISKKN